MAPNMGGRWLTPPGHVGSGREGEEMAEGNERKGRDSEVAERMGKKRKRVRSLDGVVFHFPSNGNVTATANKCNPQQQAATAAAPAAAPQCVRLQ